MHNPPLVLVIDDERDFAEVLSTKLIASGFAVQAAYDGEEAIRKAKELAPDLILMDVKMPKRDGVGALLKLKEDEATKHINVVLMTAFGDPQQEIYENDQRLAQQLGATGYVLKTQDLDDIVEKVRGLVGR